jgi:hypothetical protein
MLNYTEAARFGRDAHHVMTIIDPTSGKVL